MKILKPGNMEEVKGVKHFVCGACACEWLADSTEYWQDASGKSKYPAYFSKCPTCGWETGLYIDPDYDEDYDE